MSDAHAPAVARIPRSNTISTIARPAVSAGPSEAHIIPSAAAGKIDAGFKPFVRNYAILAEYKKLPRDGPRGVYVVPSAESVLAWHGVIVVRHGTYEGGVFKFAVHIPETYPEESPEVFFLNDVFHPAIDGETGRLDMRKQFPQWRRGKHQLCDVLHYIKRIFYKVDPEMNANIEASRLLQKDSAAYAAHVQATIAQINSRIYDNEDQSDIKFSPWKPDVHSHARQAMLERRTPDEPPAPHAVGSTQLTGLSWVAKGSNTSFSKGMDF